MTFKTGDPLIDKWERELAMGLEPDLLEGLPSWHREAAEQELAEISQPASVENIEEVDGFSDDYTQADMG